MITRNLPSKQRARLILFWHKMVVKMLTAAKWLVSFAAVFRDVTKRSPERVALRDLPKDGCEGDYEMARGIASPLLARLWVVPNCGKRQKRTKYTRARETIVGWFRSSRVRASISPTGFVPQHWRRPSYFWNEISRAKTQGGHVHPIKWF